MVEGGSFAWLNSQTAVVGRGTRTVEMSPDDNSWIVNGLAVRPGRVIMPEGISERTRDALEGHGVEIVTLPYDGDYHAAL